MEYLEYKHTRDQIRQQITFHETKASYHRATVGALQQWLQEHDERYEYHHDKLRTQKNIEDKLRTQAIQRGLRATAANEIRERVQAKKQQQLEEKAQRIYNQMMKGFTNNAT